MHHRLRSLSPGTILRCCASLFEHGQVVGAEESAKACGAGGHLGPLAQPHDSAGRHAPRVPAHGLWLAATTSIFAVSPVPAPAPSAHAVVIVVIVLAFVFVAAKFAWQLVFPPACQCLPDIHTVCVCIGLAYQTVCMCIGQNRARQAWEVWTSVMGARRWREASLVLLLQSGPFRKAKEARRRRLLVAAFESWVSPSLDFSLIASLKYTAAFAWRAL